MIDASKLNYRERWKLFFAFAAAQAIWRDDNQVGELMYTGMLDENFQPYDPRSEEMIDGHNFRAPSYNEIYAKLEEILGFNCDEMYHMDTMCPWTIPTKEEE